MKPSFLSLLVLLLALNLWSYALGQSQEPPASPSAIISYLEGQAYLDNELLTSSSIGSARLEKGRSIITHDGKVGITVKGVLTLRLAENSALKMISFDLDETAVQLDKGRAMLQVTGRPTVNVLNIRREGEVRVDQNGMNTTLLKNGLYLFNADQQQILVFKGAAQVHAKQQTIRLADEQDLTVTSDKLKAENFDIRRYENALIQFDQRTDH